MGKKYYLYRHIRNDKNEPFYIGIGTYRKDRFGAISSKDRAYMKSGRNNLWEKITKKTTYNVEIILESENLDFIRQKEIEFIKLYGRKDNSTGILANMTDGGEGRYNSIFSDKERLNKSIATKKRYALFPMSQETKDKIGKANKGRKMSEEFKLKNSIAKIGKKLSEETKTRISLAKKGIKITEITKNKISLMHLPLEKKELILDYIKKNIPITIICKNANVSNNSLRKIAIENGYTGKVFRVMNEDGKVFKTVKEAADSVNSNIKALSIAIKKGYKCNKVTFTKIYKYEKIEIL